MSTTSVIAATSDESTFDTLAGRFDLIINTVSATVALDACLSLLRPAGVLVNVAWRANRCRSGRSR